MKKKFILFVLCSVFSSTLLGCGGKDSKAADSVAGTAEISGSVSVPESEPEPIVIDYAFDIPEGFLADESSEGFWTASDGSGATIQYSTLDYSDSIYDCSAESIETEMETQFTEMGYEIDVTVDSFEKQNIDGYDRFRVEFSYLYGNTGFKQIQLILISKNLVGNLIYTDINDSGWKEAFEDSISSIRVITE